MKRMVSTLCSLLLLMIVMMGCKNDTYEVSISADRNFYSPSMSSIHGIVLNPNLRTDNRSSNLVYNWSTTSGGFLNPENNAYSKEIKNQGKGILWTAITDEGEKADKSITITLKVEDKSSGKVLAENTLVIEEKEGAYWVKK